MPGTAGGSAQPGVGLPKVHKSMAPAPPGESGPRPGSSSEAPNGVNSRNFPDVTADIYDPASADLATGAESDIHSVVPDYPMDSLPRHASTRSLPSNSQQEPRTAAPVNTRSSQPVPETTRIGAPRTSPRTTEPPQSLVPITGLSSSTGNIPVPVGAAVQPMLAHIPAQHPAQVYSVSHSIPTSIPPTVSHSNVSVNVSHSGQVPVHGDPRQIRTQDLSVGVVSRQGNILPDLITQAQPNQVPRQVASPQRPNVPLVDPRLAQSREHRHIVDPHARHRHHRDRRHGRSHRHSRRHSHSSGEEPCKESCFKCLAVGTSFRWILVVLSLLGVCCVVTGIILAALHAAGNSFLFLAIMFIGLGVLLVVVVGVGWKCTPRGHEPLHALFNLGDFRNRRGSSRRHRDRRQRRDGRWYGGSLYPEFQYRRPPPSYNASMQEYQQQLAAQQSQGPDLYDPENIPDEDYSLPSSPPPSYRSRASTVRAGIQITFPPNQGGDYPDSRPPTYRSHPSNTLQGRHSRPSLSRDDEDNDTDNPAPADVAFTGSSVIVDTNASQNSTSIQISPAVATNQNVTVSVTTVSVTTSPPILSALHPPLEGQGSTAAPSDPVDHVDPVGEGEADRVETSL